MAAGVDPCCDDPRVHRKLLIPRSVNDEGGHVLEQEAQGVGVPQTSILRPHWPPLECNRDPHFPSGESPGVSYGDLASGDLQVHLGVVEGVGVRPAGLLD